MTQPKEKGGVPPIEIYTIIGKGVEEIDPTKQSEPIDIQDPSSTDFQSVCVVYNI